MSVHRILCSETAEMVTVRADSEDDVCGLVAVQPLRCPFADSVSLSQILKHEMAGKFDVI